MRELIIGFCAPSASNLPALTLRSPCKVAHSPSFPQGDKHHQRLLSAGMFEQKVFLQSQLREGRSFLGWYPQGRVASPRQVPATLLKQRSPELACFPHRIAAHDVGEGIAEARNTPWHGWCAGAHKENVPSGCRGLPQRRLARPPQRGYLREAFELDLSVPGQTGHCQLVATCSARFPCLPIITTLSKPGDMQIPEILAGSGGLLPLLVQTERRCPTRGISLPMYTRL